MLGHRGLNTFLGMQRECGMEERQSRVSFWRMPVVGELESFSGHDLGVRRLAQSSLRRRLYTWQNAKSLLPDAYIFLCCCKHCVWRNLPMFSGRRQGLQEVKSDFRESSFRLHKTVPWPHHMTYVMVYGRPKTASPTYITQNTKKRWNGLQRPQSSISAHTISYIGLGVWG